jgi:hypothetical protein
MGLLEDLRLPMMSVSSAIRARPEREETRNGEKKMTVNLLMSSFGLG